MDWSDRRSRIDEDDPEYLWRQIADDLLAEIRAGALAPGARLPTEPDLADAYGVARQTMRRAIRELRNEGVLVVRYGKGTFVARR